MVLALLFICAPKSLTVVGTIDLHGRLHTLPLLSSYYGPVGPRVTPAGDEDPRGARLNVDPTALF